MHAVGRQLQDPDGTAPHAVTAPAEHHGVDSAGQDPLKQYLSRLLVQQPTKDEVHRAQ
jgi:hypothetical protein